MSIAQSNEGCVLTYNCVGLTLVSTFFVSLLHVAITMLAAAKVPTKDTSNVQNNLLDSLYRAIPHINNIPQMNQNNAILLFKAFNDFCSRTRKYRLNRTR